MKAYKDMTDSEASVAFDTINAKFDLRKIALIGSGVNRPGNGLHDLKLAQLSASLSHAAFADGIRQIILKTWAAPAAKAVMEAQLETATAVSDRPKEVAFAAASLEIFREVAAATSV
jgi:hypothetical protein